MDDRMISQEIYRYVCNLPFFPDGYFEQHTAEELQISEQGRQKLIEFQRTKCISWDFEVNEDTK